MPGQVGKKIALAMSHEPAANVEEAKRAMQDKIDNQVIKETDAKLASQGLVEATKRQGQQKLNVKPKTVKVKPDKDGNIETVVRVVDKEAQPEIVTLPNGMQVPILMSRAERKALEREVKRGIRKNRPIKIK
jgi:hypothetical protein